MSRLAARPALPLALLAALTAQPGPAHAQGSVPACALPPGPLPTRTRAVFVLDTSGSMRGLGDGRADIFGRVTAAINTYVRTTRPDRVDLTTFDAGVRRRVTFDAPAGTSRWNAALAALRADGTNTHVYASVRAALAPLTGAATYVTTVFVLTDGIDNDPRQAVTPAQALAAFGARGPLDRLHYVALGTDIPAEARRALETSAYADGVTVRAGTVPDLVRTGHGGGLLRVTDPARLPVPAGSAGPLRLATAAPVRLTASAAPGGPPALEVTGPVVYGAPAVLCAEPAPPPDGTVPASTPTPVRVLLRLNLPGAGGLRAVNPAADRVLARGESVVLRYRVPAGQRGTGARVEGVPTGLRTEVRALPGSRDLTVTFVNDGLPAGRAATPVLVLPGGEAAPLPTVRAAAPPAQTASPAPAGPGDPRGPAGWGPWVLAAAVLAGLGVLVAATRRRARPAAPRAAARAVPAPPAAPADVPGIGGIEYSEDRLLSLVGLSGDITGVATPLGLPFDVGHLARVPHLSGLRFEQHRHGLRCTQIPADLEVSQGARLLRTGDIVRPGTLLGVAVARPARAPALPLGALAGLGLPLTLRTHGHTVHAGGPYGEHAVTLRPGVTDLGDALDAPALRGVRLAATGDRVLLAEVPPGVGLRRPGESGAITPGTALTGTLNVDLPGDTDDLRA